MTSYGEYAQQFTPLLDALTQAIGSTFYLEHTGGGIMAMSTVLESGQLVMISDYGDAGLSPIADKRGYWIGIYSPTEPHGEYCEQDSIDGRPDLSADELPAYVAEFLAGYASGVRVNPFKREG